MSIDLRRWLALVAPLLAVVVGLVLLAGGSRAAYALEPVEPNKAVAQDLSAQGYDVLEVTGPDTDEGADTATVVMTIASDQLDEKVTAQLQAGWVALSTYYKDTPNLRVGLFYQQRYILVWVIGSADWASWLGGNLPKEQFWDHVQFAVYDTVEQKYLDSGKSFLDKNFNSNTPPGLNGGPDPANVPGAASGLLLDVSSLLVPADNSDGATVLARVMDEQGLRVPGQTVTFTVSTRKVGDFSGKKVPTDADGVARSSYIPLAGLKVPASGVPVAILATGGGKLNATQKLLVARWDDTSQDASTQAATAALQNAGYKVVDFYVTGQTAPTGEVYIYGGPFMNAKSSQFDAAFFQQAKAGMGTTLAAFPQMTSVFTFMGFTVQKKTYWLRFLTARTNWDAWVAGQKSEQDFWGGVDIIALDNKGNPVDQQNFADKNFGTGQTIDVHTTDTSVSYTASLVNEDWGPQHYYGEFSLPAGATMDGFSAQRKDGATAWRIYEVNNMRDPVFDSDTDDAAKLTLVPGTYFLMVVADNPPASVTIKARQHVRY